MTKVRARPNFPLFRLYTFEELEESLHGLYSGITLVSIRDGLQPPSSRFRRVVSLNLGRTEEELFGPADVETEMETPVADEQEA